MVVIIGAGRGVRFRRSIYQYNRAPSDPFRARVAKSVDARDLKSLGFNQPCRFESGSGHHRDGAPYEYLFLMAPTH